jgi:hypothetical protein
VEKDLSVVGPLIREPLVVVEAAARLARLLQQYGYEVKLSGDCKAFSSAKQAIRNETVTPYFDYNVAALSEERFFWMMLTSPDLTGAGLQAFRLDDVSTSLADWAVPYTIGIYMQRGEILVPRPGVILQNSAACDIRGRLVYNGELWIAPKVRNRMVYETFSKLGLLLALIRWIPDCVWALAEKSMATHGHPIRGGYSTIENGFLRWQWAGQNIPTVEWLHLANRRAIEQLAEQVCIELPQGDASDPSLPNR